MEEDDFFALPSVVYNSILQHLPSEGVSRLSVVSKNINQNVTSLLKDEYFWLGLLASKLDTSPEDLTIPQGITAKEIYEDMEETPVEFIRAWLSGNMDHEEKNAFLYTLTEKRVGAIAKFLLLPQAKENYESLLPHMDIFPSPTATSLKLDELKIDLDVQHPKPIAFLHLWGMTFERLPSPEETALVCEVRDLGKNSLEMYDVHLLAPTLTLDDNEAVVFKDVVVTSRFTRHYNNVYLRKEEDGYLESKNLAVCKSVWNVPSIYTAFTACKSMGIKGVNMSGPSSHTIVFRHILCAWLTGLDSIMLVDVELPSNSNVIDILDRARTPREFVDWCGLLTDVDTRLDY